MKAEIITIGDEILIGQVVDTNSAWIAGHLNDLGIPIHRITSISDTTEEILAALAEAGKRSDAVLLTGGLGPTKDDVTKAALCTYFNTRLVLNEGVLAHVKSLFESFGHGLLEVNRQQAEVPESCDVIVNRRGTAPGMWFNHKDCVYVVMPGVPYEMKEMMKEYILPRMASCFNTPHIVQKTILTQGLGESFLAEKIKDWENSLNGESIRLAYLPSPGVVRLRLSATGENREALSQKIERKAGELHELISTYIFGYGEDTMESVVSALFRKNEQTLATAESCTGGYLSHLITSVPGASAYFKGGVVAYANPVKEEALSVDPLIIERFGAVSEEVVRAMAEGARKRFNTDYAVSCSGIAGPDGGSEQKPVGTVWISTASAKAVKARMLRFGSDRYGTIRMAALTALNMLRNHLLEELTPPRVNV